MPIDPREALNELLLNYKDQAAYLNRADRYYRAEPNSVNIGPRVPRALARFRTAWPAVRVVTNAYSDRVRLEDILFSNESAEEIASGIRDPLSTTLIQSVHEALAVGTGYIRIVPTDDDFVFAACRGRDAAFLEDPDTTETLATMRIHRPARFKGAVTNPQRVTVYVPGAAVQYGLESNGRDPWTEIERVEFDSEILLMRPLINRARAGEAYGRAEARDLYPIQDQGSRSLTNLSIVSDALAVPQRVLIAANPAEIQNLSQIQTYMDTILALTGEVKVDQWAAAQLQPFVEEMILLSRQAAATSGIPLSYWGIASDANGNSADSIRENDTRLDIRSRQLAAQWTTTVRAVARDSARIRGVDPGVVQAKWINPATPTPSAAVDAGTKLASIPPVGGQPIADAELIWDTMGVSADDRQRMREARDAMTLDRLLEEAADESQAGSSGSPTDNDRTSPSGTA